MGMEFGMRCNLCQKMVKGDPARHLLEEHKPLEFFTLVAMLEWASVGVKLPPPEKENPLKV